MKQRIIWILIGIVCSLLLFGGLTHTLPFSMLEIVGFISGIISIQYAVQNDILTWPTGIINSLAFLFLFIPVGLYANIILQLIYIVQELWAWNLWRTKKISITISQPLFICSMILVSIPMTIALIGGSSIIGWNLPFWDTFTAVVSVIATYLLAKKKIGNWWLWIGVDCIYIYLFFTQQLYLTSILYVVFLFQAITGFVYWKQQERIHATV